MESWSTNGTPDCGRSDSPPRRNTKKKTQGGITWIQVDGRRCDLWRIHERISKNQDTVAYSNFWQRIRNLNRRLNRLAGQFGAIAVLNDALLIEAATDDNASWRRGWGPARISPLVYEGKLYPTYREFAHAMGREKAKQPRARSRIRFAVGSPRARWIVAAPPSGRVPGLARGIRWTSAPASAAGPPATGPAATAPASSSFAHHVLLL